MQVLYLLFQRFFDPVRNLGEDWQTVQSALSGIERIVQMLQIPAERKPDLSSLRACFSGGAPMPLAIMEAFEKRFGSAHVLLRQRG